MKIIPKVFSLAAFIVSSAVFSDDIIVYFNHPVYEPGEQANLEDKIIEVIESANSSIDIAVYDLDLADIAQALADAKNNGINVRYITDYDNTDNEDILEILENADIEWIDDTADGSSGSGIMHNKYIVVDDHLVLTGSTNMTQSGIHGDLNDDGDLISEGNENHIVIIESIELADAYTTDFEQMWGDGPGGDEDSLFGLSKVDHDMQTVYTTYDNTQIDAQFSPTSSSTYEGSTIDTIVQWIETASEHIYIAQFVFSSQDVSDAMELRHDAGAEVLGLGDSLFFEQYYSEFNDIMGIVITDSDGNEEVDSFSDAENNPWDNPANAREAAVDSNDIFHHKYLIVDSSVMTGSHNISTSAATQNDENIIFIYDEETASEFSGHFEYAYCLAGDSDDCASESDQESNDSTNVDSYEAGTWEGVDFTADEVASVLDTVNNASEDVLDDDVPLDARAATNIVEARTITSMDELAAVSYVGSSAMQALKDYIPTWSE